LEIFFVGVRWVSVVECSALVPSEKLAIIIVSQDTVSTGIFDLIPPNLLCKSCQLNTAIFGGPIRLSGNRNRIHLKINLSNLKADSSRNMASPWLFLRRMCPRPSPKNFCSFVPILINQVSRYYSSAFVASLLRWGQRRIRYLKSSYYQLSSSSSYRSYDSYDSDRRIYGGINGEYTVPWCNRDIIGAASRGTTLGFYN